MVHLVENQSLERVDDSFGLRRAAARRFWRLFAGGFWRRVKSIFGQGQDGLHNLAVVTQDTAFESSRHVGATTVPVDLITGSEGKSQEFDREFRPLKSFSRDRWISIAVARLQGKSLPPVELIKVGDEYYVRDGHHRISVARAYGQVEVDAVVTSWKVAAAV
ncbi:MAG: hypothetical protein JSW55_06445 [Chloroflexota bacterium]|nr:MAG: hypothetical protein JSW55_06445 [Chloroflexota bacterium]